MDVQYTPLNSLTIGNARAAIRVRISRVWDSINLKTNEVFGFNMQLLDIEGEEMHAEVGARFMSLFSGRVKEGLVYDITEFNVAAAGITYLTVHRPIKIQFNALTTVTEVQDDIPDIPMHKFSFTDYSTIIKRTHTIKYLTDVIGILHHVGEVVSQSTGSNASAPKRELVLYLHCGNRISATLWGSKTSLVDPTVLDENNKTVILTSMTVKNYLGKPTLGSTTATYVYTNLDIAEGNELIRSFRKRKLPAITDDQSQVEKQAAIIVGKTLSEILSLDLPMEYEDKTFAFQAKITDVNLSNGWEYLSCNVCKRKVGNSISSTYCEKCEEDAPYPLHRFRVELIVDDGTFPASIVLFDKVAEYLLKQKAETLYAIQQSEVGGSKKVETIVKQLIGCTEIFHAKFDKVTASNRQRKLIASKIATHGNDKEEPKTASTSGKVAPTAANKAPQNKRSSKKFRLDYTLLYYNWGHELIVKNRTITHLPGHLQFTTNPTLTREYNKSITTSIQIHGKIDDNITLARSLLHSQGIQVDISPLPAPRELNAALEHSRKQKKFLERILHRSTSTKNWNYYPTRFNIQQKIKELESHVPYHTTSTCCNVNKVIVRINNSVGGISISTKDLLHVLRKHKFNIGPFSSERRLQPSS